jgi:DNA-binding XRE family transcriptional regulator
MSSQDTEQAQRRRSDEAAATDSDDAQTPSSQRSGAHGSSDTKESRAPGPKKSSGKKKQPRSRNNVRKLRTERMMSKAELARRAGLSTLTVDRVEKGMPCRMDTKRKILEALGLTPSDRVAVFGEED